MTYTSGASNADHNYTRNARLAIRAAVDEEHDFGGWVARVLSSVAADLGSSDALTAARPGSWEAAHVRGLVNGTIGWGDEFLADYRDAV